MCCKTFRGLKATGDLVVWSGLGCKPIWGSWGLVPVVQDTALFKIRLVQFTAEHRDELQMQGWPSALSRIDASKLLLDSEQHPWKHEHIEIQALSPSQASNSSPSLGILRYKGGGRDAGAIFVLALGWSRLPLAPRSGNLEAATSKRHLRSGNCARAR